jgi:murein DD-endopeptidase MepM/ murein hydrolase activator NlpD
MKILLMLILFLVSPLLASAAWTVATPTVASGELAVLKWQRENRPVMMVGSFKGKRFYSEQTDFGLIALIGVDIDLSAGQYPIRLVSVDANSVPHLQTLQLNVTQKDRGVSRITLPPEMVTPKGKELLARIKSEHLTLAAIFAKETGPLLIDRFVRPVPDSINSVFGKKRILNGLPRAPHSGTDFRSPYGRLIRSPARGDVVFDADLYYTGRTVILDHGGGLYSLYAHLSESLCSVGQRLAAGQPLGKVGSTGRSTGAHLHWTVRLRETRIDPVSLLERLGQNPPVEPKTP